MADRGRLKAGKHLGTVGDACRSISKGPVLKPCVGGIEVSKECYMYRVANRLCLDSAFSLCCSLTSLGATHCWPTPHTESTTDTLGR